jgi:hypothetical protein
MKARIAFTFLILPTLICWACRKPYNPAVVSANLNYLVVEGNITSGDTTIIKLSRTTPVGSSSSIKPELKASITIQSDQNNSYTLTETGNGNYRLNPVTLDKSKKYSLIIKTSEGKTYQSDFVEMKITPPIDSIYYQAIQGPDTALQFYVNAHDPQNSTRYYRWDYTETWSYVSCDPTFIKYKNGAIVPLDQDSLYYTCYRSDFSNQVFVASTTQLSNDVVNAQPIGAITPASQKLSHIYTMLLSQYAVTPEGLTYYTNLKKNTEQLGSIFDAVPSTIQGNIHCIGNPQETVLGFISASTISRKRIIVKYNNIPIRAQSYFGPPDPADCAFATATVSFQPKSSLSARLKTVFGSGTYLPFSINLINGIDTSGYGYTLKECVDCRFKGGTNIRPSFFPKN